MVIMGTPDTRLEVRLINDGVDTQCRLRDRSRTVAIKEHPVNQLPVNQLRESCQ